LARGRVNTQLETPLERPVILNEKRKTKNEKRTTKCTKRNPTMKRTELLAKIREEQVWDIIVIGGGATGLGSAVDAASRGLKVLLLEAYDFAKGTSSRSTKLVHGGVRYLAQGNVGLVREALRERGLMKQNAPHLVHDMGFVIPAYDWWAGPFYGVGLKLYDVLAGKLKLGSTAMLNRETALEHVPTLETEGLSGGVLYYDGQFDDSRLAITLMRTVFDLGGIALNYTPITGLVKIGGRVAGVFAQDSETGETLEIRGKAVINATGVFVDSIRRMDEPQVPDMLSPSQGVHVVVKKHFQPGKSALMVPKTDDGRVLFAVPWHDHVVIGTTDTPVEKATLEPRPLLEEVEFILKHAQQYLTSDPTPDDVLSVYVGLRPLVKAEGVAGTAALSRDHTLRISSSGLLTITGGKWTTYRRMGQEVVEKALEVGQIPESPSITVNLRLHGYTDTPLPEPLRVYGSDAPQILALEGAEIMLHPELPYSEAEVRWAVRFEMARTIEDILSRRTRALLLGAQASLEAAPRVAQILAEELGQDAAWQSQQLEQYRALAGGYLITSVV
jgi:glycerol-3-phosphate dehydrogenase